MPDGITNVVGRDVLVIGNQNITALASGEAIKFTPDGAIAQLKVSKDGNAVYNMRYSGIGAKLTVRLLRNSYDDQTINGWLAQWINDPASFSLLPGKYVKRTGDGAGTVGTETYDLAGGVPEGIPEGHTNTDGDPEQGVVVWTFLFVNKDRLLT